MKHLEENYTRTSLIIEAIRYITLYYFSIAILLTLGQVIFEYNDIKNNIYSSINELSMSFNDSLANSIWEFNDNQTQTILAGILESPSVLGVKLINNNNEVMYAFGDTEYEKPTPSMYDFFLTHIAPNQLFEFKVNLSKKLDDNTSENVGVLHIYSGNKIILDQLSRIMFYIIVNSVLKTISLWIVLIIFFNTRVKAPLQRLVEKIKTLDPQNPEPIELPEASNTEEIFQIIHSFNNLTSELKNFKDILEAIIDNKTELLKEKSIEVRNLINKLEDAQAQIINQEKLNSLGLVSAGIAHELKNPLNISLNSVIILKDLLGIKEVNTDVKSITLTEKNFDKAQDVIKMIYDSNHRMENIITNMLLQSRTEYTKPTEVELKPFIDMNIRIVQKSLKTNASNVAKIDLSVEDRLKAKVFPNELGRLLVNLFENSFYALEEKMKQNSDFQPELSARVEDTSDKIVLYIRDNGIGIPSNIKARILEPFFTTKPTGLGTGLGLYLCYEIIKKHYGEISIDSEVNQYTEFMITIPKNLETYYH